MPFLKASRNIKKDDQHIKEGDPPPPLPRSTVSSSGPLCSKLIETVQQRWIRAWSISLMRNSGDICNCSAQRRLRGESYLQISKGWKSSQ